MEIILSKDCLNPNKSENLNKIVTLTAESIMPTDEKPVKYSKFGTKNQVTLKIKFMKNFY